MTTGARRGELLALREDRFDFDVQTVRFSKNYLVKDGRHIEKSPKTGRGRIVSLDPCGRRGERALRRLRDDGVI